MRLRLSFALLAVAAAALLLLSSRGEAQDATAELPTGGLSFVPITALTKESEELLISRERMRITYVIRNTSAEDIAIRVSFQLPDIDMMSIGEQEVLLPSMIAENFVDHETRVDDARVPGTTWQAAFAAARDVTQTLQSHAIPLFPFSDDVAPRLSELSEEVRRELLEAGILRHDADRPEPGWTLKTTFSWRQVFPAGKTVRIVHSYRPVIASSRYSPADLGRLAKQHCVDRAVESAAAEQSAARKGGAELQTLTYLAAPGAVWWGQTGELRIAIEKQDPSTQVATCWRGFRAAGPTLLEWSGRDVVIEDDIHVLFIR